MTKTTTGYVLAQPRTTGRREATLRRRNALGARLRVRTVWGLLGGASALKIIAKSYPEARTVFMLTTHDARTLDGRLMMTFASTDDVRAYLATVYATLQILREQGKRNLVTVVTGRKADAAVAELMHTLRQEPTEDARSYEAEVKVVGGAL